MKMCDTACMKKNNCSNNMGTADRTIRSIVGLIIVILGFWYQTWWGLLGLIPLWFGIWGSCPIYTPFHFSTNKNNPCDK